MKQKGQLQSAIADVGKTAPQTQGAYIENQLSSAIVRQESREYYEQFGTTLVEAAKLKPIRYPQFTSPYSGNYNTPGVADPTKLVPPPGVMGRSGVGSLDFNVGAPKFSSESFDRYQADSRARYAEFVANPAKIQVSPDIGQQVQNRARDRERGVEPTTPVKPIQVTLQMTNDRKSTIGVLAVVAIVLISIQANKQSLSKELVNRCKVDNETSTISDFSYEVSRQKLEAGRLCSEAIDKYNNAPGVRL